MPSSVRIPALVAGTPARCPGVLHSAAARASAASPPVPRAEDPGHQPSRLVRSGDPVSSPGGLRASGANADRPAGGLDPLGPLPPSTAEALSRTGGGRPAELGRTALRPEGTLLVAANRPFLHAAVPQHFRHRGGRAAAIPNQTQELACDSSAWTPPVPKLSSRSFLGRRCPMCEPFLPKEEDGLRAASWGLFVIRAVLGLRGGDGAGAGSSSHSSEELLMSTGYAQTMRSLF